MVIKSPSEFNAKDELAKGAWHVWDFGPNLLTESGEAINDFSHRSDIKGANPRTAIGYYDPGHYCFVVAGGRKKGYAYGVTLSRLSGFMEYIGCNVAYNLDGGQSSVMTFGDSIVNEKYQGTGRDNSDMVFIWDFTE
jgi:exopolysaccharide biosynthesis protein